MGGSNPKPRKVDRNFGLRGTQKIQSLKDLEVQISEIVFE